MSLNPSIWGKHAWIFLHSITLEYPDCATKEEKKQYKAFFTSIQHILPCNQCRIHYTANLKKYPLTDKILCDKEQVIKWLINIHNSVNKETNKPEFTYDEFLLYYNKLYSDKNKQININKYAIYSLIIVIVIIIILGCVVKYNK
jgi:hypothetical protein